MPKLPGAAQYGLAQAPVPNPQMPPGNAGLAQAPAQAAQLGMRAAMQPNVLQITAEGMGQITDAQIRAQSKDDAIGRLRAADAYTSGAEAIVAEEGDPTDKAWVDGQLKKLDDLRTSTIGAFPGSDQGREMLGYDLNEMHRGYTSAFAASREKATNQLVDNHLDRATNRFVASIYRNPGTYPDSKALALEFFDSNLAPTMDPQVAMSRRLKLEGEIDVAAVDSLIERDQFAGAEMLLMERADTISPDDRRTLARKIDSNRSAMSTSSDWTLGADGVRMNKATGDVIPPPPEVQAYFQGLKTAGKTDMSVNVDTAGQSEFAKTRSKKLAEDLGGYQERAQQSSSALRQAEDIDRLLQGQPTGTWGADVAAMFKQQFSLGDEQVASREAAEAATFSMVLEKAKQVGPVTGPDIALLRRLTPGTAQTPGGRRTLVYILNRSAEYQGIMAGAAAKISDAVGEGRMTEGNARRALAEVQRKVDDRFSRTFSPPEVK